MWLHVLAPPLREEQRAVAQRFSRLSSSDLTNLRLDQPRSPFQVSALATVEGAALLDEAGRLRLPEIKDRLARRIAGVPQLRKRLHHPGWLRGRALWVDDTAFDINQHVFEAAVGPPGDDPQLFEAAAQLHSRLLDRSTPLWELWFLTGLSAGRVGLLFKLHHALADGRAAVAIFGSLFDLEPDAPAPALTSTMPQPIPGSWPLFFDNISSKGRTLRRFARTVVHPVTLARDSRAFYRELRRTLEQVQAPRTSLNRQVEPGRRLRAMRVDLVTAKGLAHAHGGKLNDVVLDLWAGGLRQLLAARAEGVKGGELITAVAVSLRANQAAGDLGNDVGILAVPLPIAEGNSAHRLDLIAAASRKAKAEQHPAAVQSAVGGLAAATPVAQYITSHQHMVNVFSTNLAGPPVPVYVLGGRIIDILPIIQVTGNVTLSLCAFSYAGTLFLSVTADAVSNPDIDVLMAGMAATWQELTVSGE